MSQRLLCRVTTAALQTPPRRLAGRSLTLIVSSLATLLVDSHDTGTTAEVHLLRPPLVAGSNAKALWVKNRPMNDEELLQQQVVMSTSASLGQSVWVYRGSMWAYPWYTSVRLTLEDPAYSDWYVKFKPQGPWYSDKCDRNYDPPLCSDLCEFHALRTSEENTFEHGHYFC